MKKLILLAFVVMASAALARAEQAKAAALGDLSRAAGGIAVEPPKTHAGVLVGAADAAASPRFEGTSGIYGGTPSAREEEEALGSAESEARKKCHSAGYAFCKTIREKVTRVTNGVQALVVVEPVQVPTKVEKFNADVEAEGYATARDTWILRLAEKSAVATCQNVRYKNCLPIAASFLGCRQGGSAWYLCRAKATAIGWNN